MTMGLSYLTGILECLVTAIRMPFLSWPVHSSQLVLDGAEC